MMMMMMMMLIMMIFSVIFLLTRSCCINPSECQGALGMANGAIVDAEISASSQFDAGSLASHGRLSFQGGWTAAAADVNPWLQIDLGKGLANVTRVATQGRWGASQWVTKYNLQYGDSILNFQYYKELGQNTSKVNYTDP